MDVNFAIFASSATEDKTRHLGCGVFGGKSKIRFRKELI